MSAPDDAIDRKTFLQATLAWAAVTLSGCGGTSGNGGTGGRGTTGSGGAATGGSTGSGGSSSGGVSGSGGMSSSGGSNGSGGSTSSGGSNGSGGMNGSGGDNGSGGMTGSGGDNGGSGGDGSGGMSGGIADKCQTDTFNGNHSHPVMIPSSDVDRGFQDAPYLLEDGGTGHTHTLEVTAYDFIYLKAGVSKMIDSSMNAGHLHNCTILCTAG